MGGGGPASMTLPAWIRLRREASPDRVAVRPREDADRDQAGVAAEALRRCRTWPRPPGRRRGPPRADNPQAMRLPEAAALKRVRRRRCRTEDRSPGTRLAHRHPEHRLRPGHRPRARDHRARCSRPPRAPRPPPPGDFAGQLSSAMKGSPRAAAPDHRRRATPRRPARSRIAARPRGRPGARRADRRHRHAPSSGWPSSRPARTTRPASPSTARPPPASRRRPLVRLLHLLGRPAGRRARSAPTARASATCRPSRQWAEQTGRYIPGRHRRRPRSATWWSSTATATACSTTSASSPAPRPTAASRPSRATPATGLGPQLRPGRLRRPRAPGGARGPEPGPGRARGRLSCRAWEPRHPSSRAPGLPGSGSGHGDPVSRDRAERRPQHLRARRRTRSPATSPASTTSAGMALANDDPQRGPGAGVERPARAGRALLGAAEGRRAHHGPAGLSR